jgi:hypothetical protein
MNKTAYNILRVGIAITFLWIGLLILKDPIGWGGYVAPWAENLIPFPMKSVMLFVGFFDITVGLMFLLDIFVLEAALAGVVHLFTVLAVAGINAITVRDIGLFSACLAIFFENYQK